MNIEDLRDFLKVVEVGQISAAAEQRFISRQALRSSISAMEQELGAPLLKRSAKGAVPTSFGLYFAERAKEFDRNFLELSNAYADFLQKTERTIRVSMMEVDLPWTRMVREICNAFLACHTEYQVEYRYADGAMLEHVFQEDVDIALLESSAPIPNCERIELLPSEYVVCIASSVPVAHQKVILIEDLKKLRFITRSPQTYIYRWLRQNGISQDQILFDSNNFDVKKAMIASGYVVGFSNVEFLNCNSTSYGADICFIPTFPPNISITSLYAERVKLQRKDGLAAFWAFAGEYLQRVIRSHQENNTRKL